MGWTDNAAMFWNDGASFKKVTDHNRAPLSITYERLDRMQQMVDGTSRRYSVAKKRVWSTSWDMIPSTNLKAGVGGLTTADMGFSGEQIEAFHNTTNGAFQMQLRRGDTTYETVMVMITDFSKEVVKRGPRVDFWNMSITLKEV